MTSAMDRADAARSLHIDTSGISAKINEFRRLQLGKAIASAIDEGHEADEIAAKLYFTPDHVRRLNRDYRHFTIKYQELYTEIKEKIESLLEDT